VRTEYPLAKASLLAILALLACVLILPACATLSKPCAVACLPGDVCIAGLCVPIAEPTPAPTPVPVPTPTPTPNPTPTPTPNPTPTPVPGACSNLPAEGSLVMAPVQRVASRTAAVVAAMSKLGDLSLPPGATPEAGHQRAEANLKALAAQLCADGFRAFAGSEAVFVLGADMLWEEFHAVFFERGQFIPGGKYIGVHTAPVPEPTPVADGCGAPAPPDMDHFVVHRRDVRDGWETFDSTPVTAEGNRAYCDSVGFQGRNSCPARAEEPSWMGGDRLACERRMLRGPAPQWRWTGAERDGGLREGSNGFTFEHRKGSDGALSVCDALGEKCTMVL
jgi:hypothetical protein